jgi:pyroglutamyl-peptidase
MKRKPTRVLVTGFEPFAGSRVNPSAEVASRLAGTAIPGVDLAIEVLPVVGVTAGKLLLAALGRIRPDAVVLLGEHGDSPAIQLERLAVNLRDYRIADNAGRVVTDRPVVRGGPDAIFATLPLRKMLASVVAAGVPCSLSNSAGTFLCNEVMYVALHHLGTVSKRRPVPCGFIHVPSLPEQTVGSPRPRPSMDAATTTRGIAAAIACLA